MEHTTYRKHNLLEKVLIYLTPLIYWTGYDYIGFDTSILKLIMFAYTLFLLLYCYKGIFVSRYKKGSYNWYMRCWLFLIFVSILMSFLFWGQGVSLGFRATGMYFAFLYYFALQKANASQKDVIKVIGLYSIIYLFLYLYGISQAPVSVFSSGDEIEQTAERGGIFRISIKSFDVVCLMYLCALAKIRGGDVMKVLPVLVFGLIMIFLALSRMIIAATLLISLFFIISKVKFRNKIIILLLSVVAVVYLGHNSTINEVVGSMFEMTEDQMSDRSASNTNLRVVEYQTAFSTYPRNAVTWLFGCGCPHPLSSYGHYELTLMNNIGFNRSDAGYPAILITFGIFGLLLFCALILKTCRQKVQPDYFGFKLYMVFIALVNLFQNATGWFSIAICIALYMLNMNEIDNFNRKKYEVV